MNLRDFAKHKPCMVRLPGICNFDPETTILAHIRRANIAGMGQKPPDTCAVWCCNSYHDLIDARNRNAMDEKAALRLDSDILDALVRQLAWYDKHEILVATI